MSEQERKPRGKRISTGATESVDVSTTPENQQPDWNDWFDVSIPISVSNTPHPEAAGSYQRKERNLLHMNVLFNKEEAAASRAVLNAAMKRGLFLDGKPIHTNGQMCKWIYRTIHDHLG